MLALAALGIVGAWASAVPYVGPALGLRLPGISDAKEVFDHVVPGVLVVVLAAAMLALADDERLGRGTPAAAAGAAVSVLAGFWITATHVGLLFDAGNGVIEWGAALLHATAGLLVLAAAIAVLVQQLRGGG